MITELTSEQEASLIPFREKWRQVGISTKEVDKEATIKAVTGLYEKLGKEQPLFIFCPSPLFCIQQINFFKFLGKDWKALIDDESNLGGNLWSNLWSNLESNLESNLWSNLWSNLESNLESNLGGNLEGNLGGNLRSNLESNLEGNLRSNLESNLESNLWSNLWSNLESNLGGNLWSNLESNLRSNLWGNQEDNDLMKEFNEYHSFWAYGQMDSAWIGFYQFMETIGIKYDDEDSELLELWAQTAKSCSWFWTFENVVFVSDRPKKLSWDDQWRLHDEHGPAYEYRDGWKGYYLHGVHFEEELYLKVISREMEMKDVLKIEDIDQRVQAIKFAKSGLREFYKSEGGKCIDKEVKLDKHGRPVQYELWRIPKGEVFTDEVHFAIYNCPSAIERGEEREYTKGVPPCKKIAEAMAWGMSDDNFTLPEEAWRKLVPLEHEA